MEMIFMKKMILIVDESEERRAELQRGLEDIYEIKQTSCVSEAKAFLDESFS